MSNGRITLYRVKFTLPCFYSTFFGTLIEDNDTYLSFFFFQQSQETLSNLNATGIAMLFSAGTFLYVSTVHVLPEVANMGNQPTTVNGTVIIREHKGFTWLELTLLVFGSLVPVVLSLGHHH
jgi:zinc transporter 9